MSLRGTVLARGSLVRETVPCGPGLVAARAEPALTAGLTLGALLACLTLGTALAADPLAADPFAAGMEEDRIVAAVTPAELQELMQDEGYAVTLDNHGVVMWKVEGLKAQLITADDRESILFHAAFDGGNATLKRVNEWNRTKRFSRSYLDEDGDPHLELDLDLSGGVTPERIRDFLRTSRTSFDAWCRDVVAAP